MKNTIISHIAHNALTTIGQALPSIMRYVTEFKNIRQQDFVLLQEQTDDIKSLLKDEFISIASRHAIHQLQITLEMIEQNYYSGIMLENSMKIYDLQFQKVYQTIQKM